MHLAPPLDLLVEASGFYIEKQRHRGKEKRVYLAMNRFKIALGFEAGFEKIWRERESYLDTVPGFKTFNLLKGPENEDHVLYASHSVWESKAAFDAWTESESFRKAHAQTSAPKGTYLGHPDLELFEAVL